MIIPPYHLSKDTAMQEQRKLWRAVGLALTTSAVAGSSIYLAPSSPATAATPALTPAMMLFQAGEGDEGGEGGQKVDLATNDAAYLAHLGLLRGHLWVGMQLYRDGHIEMAKTHMKHPKDELYAALLPSFKARQVDGFASQLEALTEAVTQQQPAAQVEAKYAQLETAITSVEQSSQKSVRSHLLALSSMLRSAAAEYKLGLDPNQPMLHEYQDAAGFTQIAIARLTQLQQAELNEAEQEAMTKALRYIEQLPELWPRLDQIESSQDSSLLYGVAARIELLAYSMS